jgi:hypothetical protein
MDLNNFINWSMLLDFTAFVAIVFMVVQFFKEMPLINKIPTKYFAAIVSFILLVISNLHAKTFEMWDLALYAITAISVSALSKGVVDYHNDKIEQPIIKEDVKEEAKNNIDV